eukprot:268956-Pelagomonas_calceolata.AAC.1
MQDGNELPCCKIDVALEVTFFKSRILLAEKSGVLHFKSRSCSSLPTSMYGDVALPEKEQF